MRMKQRTARHTAVGTAVGKGVAYLDLGRGSWLELERIGRLDHGRW